MRDGVFEVGDVVFVDREDMGLPREYGVVIERQSNPRSSVRVETNSKRGRRREWIGFNRVQLADIIGMIGSLAP